MKTKTFLLLCSVFFSSAGVAQKLPVINATSTSVDIKEDDKRSKNVWRIVPEEKLDVFTTAAKSVTFYTDIDSISFKIDPQKEYDFVILLNGKDSAKTRIRYQPQI